MTKLYHVEITPKVPVPPHRRREWEYDLSFEELEHQFLAPYRKGKSIVIRGRSLTMDDLHRIRIYETQQKIGHLTSKPTGMMADITKEFITGPAGWALGEGSEDAKEYRPPTDTREVFVVHGRNLNARDALFDFLRAIDLHPMEWSEAVQFTDKPMPYIGEILDEAFSRAHAVVVLFTPDDEARLREPFRAENDPPHETQLTGQARPNVLFEAGMAMTRDQDRTILVELGNLRPFSDVGGRHTIRLDNSSQRRQDLAKRLQSAGCPVNLDGTDWHTAGDFDAALDKLVQESSNSAVVVEQQSPIADPIQLSEDARELLVEATKDASGVIYKTQTFSGLNVETNGRNFVKMGKSRSAARWEHAIQDLLDQGLVGDRKGKGEVFEVTHKGFEVADGLGTSPHSDSEV